MEDASRYANEMAVFSAEVLSAASGVKGADDKPAKKVKNGLDIVTTTALSRQKIC